MEAQERNNGRFYEKYKVHNLVYFEQHDDMRSAIEREKRIKDWRIGIANGSWNS